VLSAATDENRRTSAVRVGILVNPMSGRDVRRLAAHATKMTHEAKRDIVARVAAGADAVGATDIFVAREPFRIATVALERMPLTAQVHALEPPVTNTAVDTEATVREFLDAGCDVIVSLGGDGTNRAIVRALGGDAERVRLIPLSTGTNNVFPILTEPTIAGMVAGLHARGTLHGAGVERRCKVLHVEGTDARGRRVRDVGLIDAVLLQDDHVGNFLPFDAERIARLLLTRAEPDAIGMSPIGGLIEPIYDADDAGLMLDMGSGTRFKAPLSPGLFRDVAVRTVARIQLGERIAFDGPGVLALDGDRDHTIAPQGTLEVTIRRDGPWVIDVGAAMRWAVAHGVWSGNRAD
jgi:hypothetical protein